MTSEPNKDSRDGIVSVIWYSPAPLHALPGSCGCHMSCSFATYLLLSFIYLLLSLLYLSSFSSLIGASGAPLPLPFHFFFSRRIRCAAPPSIPFLLFQAHQMRRSPFHSLSSFPGASDAPLFLPFPFFSFRRIRCAAPPSILFLLFQAHQMRRSSFLSLSSLPDASDAPLHKYPQRPKIYHLKSNFFHFFAKIMRTG